MQRNVPLECLDAHLKVLQVTHYKGKSSEVDLVRFFLSNARVLQSIRLVVGAVNRNNDKWVATQLKKLRPDTASASSSQGARIAFGNDRWGSSDRVLVKLIHDLSLDDLFDSTTTNRVFAECALFAVCNISNTRQAHCLP